MHISQCPEKAMDCPFPGCKQMFRRREWEDHVYARAMSHAKQTDGEIQRLKGMLYGKKVSVLEFYSNLNLTDKGVTWKKDFTYKERSHYSRPFFFSRDDFMNTVFSR